MGYIVDRVYKQSSRISLALELEEGPDRRARDTAVFLGQLGT